MTTLLPFASDYMEGAYPGHSLCTRPLTVYFFGPQDRGGQRTAS